MTAGLGNVGACKLVTPADFKFAGGQGTFEGYASVFNNTDQGGDIVVPGAFKEFVNTRDGKVLVLYQHSARDPIGKADVTQDKWGLHVRASLAMDDPTAAKVYGLMKAGVIDAMSIGFDILPGGSQTQSSGLRHLTALKLYEVSVVTFGMNPLARVEAVKTALQCGSTRELEHLFRDAPQFQFSSRKAKAAANALWPILNERDAQEDARDERAESMYVKFANRLEELTHLIERKLK